MRFKNSLKLCKKNIKKINYFKRCLSEKILISKQKNHIEKSKDNKTKNTV